MASDADIASLLRRIEALETHAAHRDRMVDDLNATITDQWKLIDNLDRRLRQLGEQLAEQGGSADPAQDPPPPHY